MLRQKETMQFFFNVYGNFAPVDIEMWLEDFFSTTLDIVLEIFLSSSKLSLEHYISCTCDITCNMLFSNSVYGSYPIQEHHIFWGSLLNDVLGAALDSILTVYFVRIVATWFSTLDFMSGGRSDLHDFLTRLRIILCTGNLPSLTKQRNKHEPTKQRGVGKRQVVMQVWKYNAFGCHSAKRKATIQVVTLLEF